MVDSSSRQVHDAVLEAKSRGVIFDLGHGMGGFNYRVAEICIEAGLWPDAISTDMHTLTCDGPAYDMPTVMSRLLHLGMPLPELIRCSTINAAAAIGWEDRIGTLGVGREADICVLEMEEVDMNLEDCHGQMRRIAQRLVPHAVWRAGAPGRITRPRRWQDPEKIALAREWYARLVVSDAKL